MTPSPPDPKETNDSPITFVRTSVPPSGKVNRILPHWLQTIHEFIGLDIQPHIVIPESSCGPYLEPCGPQDAEVWMVNGRTRSGHAEPFEHFNSQNEAADFREKLISIFPHLSEDP